MLCRSIFNRPVSLVFMFSVLASSFVFACSDDADEDSDDGEGGTTATSGGSSGKSGGAASTLKGGTSGVAQGGASAIGNGGGSTVASGGASIASTNGGSSTVANGGTSVAITGGATAVVTGGTSASTTLPAAGNGAQTGGSTGTQAGGTGNNNAAGAANQQSSCVRGVQTGDACNPTIDNTTCTRSSRTCECNTDSRSWVCTQLPNNAGGTGNEPVAGGGSAGVPNWAGAAGVGIATNCRRNSDCDYEGQYCDRTTSTNDPRTCVCTDGNWACTDA